MRSAVLPVIAALTLALVPAGVARADGDLDPGPESVRRCDDLRDAGVSLPVDRGSKYYRGFLDLDKDGLACEENERDRSRDDDKNSKDDSDDSKGDDSDSSKDDDGGDEDATAPAGSQTRVWPRGAAEAGG